ncbi:MAG: AAA family ATPase [Pyramidobacter sp.]|jgi:exonuclease SbcC
MKLCSLRLKNLNSLAGEWLVDFEAPEFRSGLFAIVGPTGSGKSTLLDAMCLALYGRTPRLDRVNNSGNEIMTRGAKDCFAEVVFEMGGTRYCAFWSQKKSVRKGAAKELQVPKCRFSRLGEKEEVLADSVTEMARQVVQICRLDFDRFTRTVMLPQGGFASFLQADGTERAKMLEDLTGAGIYRAISRKVFERTRDEREKLERIKSSAAEHSPLSDEVRDAARRRAEASYAEEARLRVEEKELAAAADWYRRREELTRQKAAVQSAAAELAEAQKAFAPRAQALAKAEQAALALDLRASLERSASRQAKSRNEVERLRGEGETCARVLAEAQQAEQEAVRKLAELRGKTEELQSVWTQTYDLDRVIEKDATSGHDMKAKAEELKKTVDEQTARDMALLAELEKRKAERAELQKALDNARTEKDQALAAAYRGDLSELAATLEDGKPCPLCGALHHPAPFDGGTTGEIHRLYRKAERASQKVIDLERKLKNCEEDISSMQMERKGLTTIVQTTQRSLDELSNSLLLCQKSLEAHQDLRRQLCGDKDPAAESKKHSARLAEAEAEHSAAEKRLSKAIVASTEREAALKRVLQTLFEQEVELAAAQKNFSDRIVKLGFADETAWTSAAMTPDAVEALRAQARRLEARQETVKAGRTAVEAGERQLSNAPTRPLEGLAEAQESNRAALTQLLKDRGADEQMLKNDENCRRRLAELGDQEKVQRKEYGRWSALNDLIGSAKGDQFSRYVQGLTFRRLVNAANLQLANLSERYRLKVSLQDSLRLDVIDLWQAGEVRTSRNLSGGESFIVSLALALALSHGMREVQVDSLFLDEGFGTLDEDALETVLDCLNRLREKGKMVGVISHVPVLRERIDCQIRLVPGAHGHSALEGPGCSRLD